MIKPSFQNHTRPMDSYDRNVKFIRGQLLLYFNNVETNDYGTVMFSFTSIDDSYTNNFWGR